MVSRTPGEQVVYELYYDPSRSATRLSKLQALEGRIAALEKAVSRAEDSEAAPTGPAGIVLTSKSQTLADAIAKVRRQEGSSTSSANLVRRWASLMCFFCRVVWVGDAAGEAGVPPGQHVVRDHPPAAGAAQERVGRLQEGEEQAGA